MPEERILASVAGETISEGDVNEMIMSMGQRGAAYNNQRGREAILEQLINKKLLLLDAKRNLFEREPEFKEQMARVKEELLSNYCIEKIVKDVRITEKEVEDFFNAHKEEFVAPERINVSHILVDSEEECLKIMDELNGGLAFEEAAKKYSSCPSKDAGGALGDATRGQFVPEFENAAFDAEVGKITGPVKTQFGYHIIRVNDKAPSGAMEFDAVRDGLREKLLQDKQQKAYQSKINQLKIMYIVDKF